MILAFSRSTKFRAAARPAVISFAVPNLGGGVTPPSGPSEAFENPFFCHVGRMIGHFVVLLTAVSALLPPS